MPKVLLVEDSKILAQALIGSLALKGVDTVWAKDGVEGVEKAKKEKPVLILLDLMLPKISGFEVCRMLKTDDKTWRIPVIIISTLTDEESRQKAFDAGADHFIDKPYSMAKTVQEILNYLSKEKK